MAVMVAAAAVAVAVVVVTMVFATIQYKRNWTRKKTQQLIVFYLQLNIIINKN
jgi:hypothetical protein